MFSRGLSAILLSIYCLVIIGCTNQNSKSSENANIVFSEDGFVIDSDTTNTFDVEISLNNKVNFSKSIKGKQIINFVDLIKEPRDKYNDIAYLLATNKGQIHIGIKINSLSDTTVNFWHGISDINTIDANLLSGTCASLHSSFAQEQVEGDIIKWLYRNHHNNVSDSTLNDIRLYLQDLNRSSYKEYLTNEKVPVISSFKGIEYNIHSDMKADYYYLFACKDEKDIDTFVEDMISLKFEGANKSINQPFSCYRLPSTNGLTCIMLIGINSNWSYQISPIGLISVDNVAPSFGERTNPYNNNDELIFKNHQLKVKSTTNVPPVHGSVKINWGRFQGRGSYLNVPYTIRWTGDVKEVRIHTSKSQSYESINLENQTSPVHVSLSTLLNNTGDNYIKVDAIDFIGNSNTSDINIATQEVKDEQPSINLNNNIYN